MDFFTINIACVCHLRKNKRIREYIYLFVFEVVTSNESESLDAMFHCLQVPGTPCDARALLIGHRVALLALVSAAHVVSARLCPVPLTWTILALNARIAIGSLLESVKGVKGPYHLCLCPGKGLNVCVYGVTFMKIRILMATMAPQVSFVHASHSCQQRLELHLQGLLFEVIVL